MGWEDEGFKGLFLPWYAPIASDIGFGSFNEYPDYLLSSFGSDASSIYSSVLCTPLLIRAVSTMAYRTEYRYPPSFHVLLRKAAAS